MSTASEGESLREAIASAYVMVPNAEDGSYETGLRVADLLLRGPLAQLQADLTSAREEREHFRERTGDLFSQLMLAEKAASDLRIRLQEAERTLKPFAIMAEPLLREKPHWATADAYAFRIHPGAVAVTYGDFYRAHAALATPIPATEEADNAP
jgi:hypothetical protein